MILPFLLTVLTIGGLAAGTLSAVSTLTIRGSRQHEQRLRAQWAVEEGIALAMQRWSSSRVAASEPGVATVAAFQPVSGPSVRVTIERFYPLVVRVSAAAGGHRQHTWIWLAPPPFPVVPAVHALAADDTLSPVGSAVSTITARTQDMAVTDPGAASFRSLFYGTAADFHSRFDTFAGLVVVHGDLDLGKVLRLNGLLIVRGTIRCLGGMLRGQGSVVLVRANGPAPAPTSCVEIQPDRDALEHALAFVAIPHRAPFHLRHWTVDEPF